MTNMFLKGAAANASLFVFGSQHILFFSLWQVILC